MALQCPSCGNSVTALIPIPAGMKMALNAVGSEGGQAPSVCQSCFEQLAGQMSQGMRLRLEREAKDKNRVILWKSRVNLIKQARQMMTQRAYSEAAMAYEKYLRILEMIFEVKRGELTPAVFSNDPRSKELTVVASVYWDLMRIYDSSTRYSQRMNETALKLAEFARFSPLFPDLIAKAEIFLRTAKNPGAVRNFLRAAHASRPRCFIATEAFYPEEPNVRILRQFRDQILKPHPMGRKFVALYYRHARFYAKMLRANPAFKPATQLALKCTAKLVKYWLKSPSQF